jgi:hypothetical protein
VTSRGEARLATFLSDSDREPSLRPHTVRVCPSCQAWPCVTFDNTIRDG